MPTYNWFGATAQGVVDRFKQGSYPAPDPAEFGDVDAALDRCETALEQALSPEVFRQLTRPELCLLVRRAQPGQLTLPLPLALRPIVANTLSVWIGPPSSFQLQPRKRTEIGTSFGEAGLMLSGNAYGNDRYPGGNFQVTELNVGQFTYDAAGGIVAINASLAMNQDDLAYGSWQTDVASEDFSVPSLAQVLMDGAAAMVGSKCYASASDAWKYVEALAAAWAEAIEAFQENRRIPSELRLIEWWKQVEKSADQTVGSSRKFRA